MCEAVLKQWRMRGPQPLNDGNWDADGAPWSETTAHASGLWLFSDRNTVDELFVPNFLPPYDTADKHAVIAQVLGEEWDPGSLKWKVVGSAGEKGAGAVARPEAAENSSSLLSSFMNMCVGTVDARA